MVNAFCYYNMFEVKQTYWLLNRRLNARCERVLRSPKVPSKHSNITFCEEKMSTTEEKKRIEETSSTEQKTLTIFAKTKWNFIGI